MYCIVVMGLKLKIKQSNKSTKKRLPELSTKCKKRQKNVGYCDALVFIIEKLTIAEKLRVLMELTIFPQAHWALSVFRY